MAPEAADGRGYPPGFFVSSDSKRVTKRDLISSDSKDLASSQFMSMPTKGLIRQYLPSGVRDGGVRITTRRALYSICIESQQKTWEKRLKVGLCSWQNLSAYWLLSLGHPAVDLRDYSG
jgi:hypothetical protein